MQALVKYAKGEGATEIRNIPVPEPLPGEVRIKIIAAGVCSSDVAMYNTDLGKHRFSPPVVLGHEGIGIIDKVGLGIDDKQIGSLVTAETTQSNCGRCYYCHRGQLNLCSNRLALGSSLNGFFAPYMIANINSVHHFNGYTMPEQLVLMEPLACATHMVIEQSTLHPGDKIVVFGPGPLGILVAQVAMSAGAEVMLVGTAHSRPRLDIASKLGVKRVIEIDRDSVREAAFEFTLGRGMDVSYICTSSNEAIIESVSVLRKRGQIVLGAPSIHNLPLTVNDIFFKEFTVKAALSTTPASWMRAISLISGGLVSFENMITHRFPLERWETAYKLVESGDCCKVVLIPE